MCYLYTNQQILSIYAIHANVSDTQMKQLAWKRLRWLAQWLFLVLGDQYPWKTTACLLEQLLAPIIHTRTLFRHLVEHMCC